MEIRLGRAVDSLAALEAEGVEPFDLVFIDADKRSNPDYLAWALRLTPCGQRHRRGQRGQGGAVVDAQTDPDIRASGA